jgi:hypothetical protein
MRRNARTLAMATMALLLSTGAQAFNVAPAAVPGAVPAGYATAAPAALSALIWGPLLALVVVLALALAWALRKPRPQRARPVKKAAATVARVQPAYPERHVRTPAIRTGVA